jgi:pyridoxal biosynthesis lyase PdxS
LYAFCVLLSKLFLKDIMSKTKTLSVRVPIDVAELVANTCKQRGINRNQLLTECIASQGVVGVNSFAKGGVAEPMDDMLTDILIGLGSITTGTVVYHLLNNNLPKTWDKETRGAVAMVSAIASSFALAYGLNKATSR